MSTEIKQLSNLVAEYWGPEARESAILRWLADTEAPAASYPAVRSATEAIVNASVGEEPEPDIPERQTGIAWFLVLGPIIIVGSIGMISAGTFSGGSVIGIIAGIALTLLGSIGWQSKEVYIELVATTRRRATEAWDAHRGTLKAEVESEVIYKFHRSLGKRVGVPRRLRAEFAQESLRNAELKRHEWRVDWWASQPAYPPPPGRMDVKVSHDEYESYCARWLHSRGWTDAAVTRYSHDGGVDIATKTYVVQCKHYDKGYVGAREVREIFGIAAKERKRAVLITSGRFTKDAIDFAGSDHVALVVLDELLGRPKLLNDAALELERGPELARGGAVPDMRIQPTDAPAVVNDEPLPNAPLTRIRPETTERAVEAWIRNSPTAEWFLEWTDDEPSKPYLDLGGTDFEFRLDFLAPDAWVATADFETTIRHQKFPWPEDPTDLLVAALLWLADIVVKFGEDAGVADDTPPDHVRSEAARFILWRANTLQSPLLVEAACVAMVSEGPDGMPYDFDPVYLLEYFLDELNEILNSELLDNHPDVRTRAETVAAELSATIASDTD